MTTKNLEDHLKISEKTCIHCQTIELAKQVLSIFHQLDLKWSDGEPYTLNSSCRYWDKYEENTVYYPFEREFSSLNYARLIDYKIINAEEFISLHTEGKKFNLENYIPKGEIEGFPKEIIARMLECQEEQWGKIDVSVFEKDRIAGKPVKGMIWADTKEGYDFWNDVIRYKNFGLFFEKYPKQDHQDNSQEFRVGDKVIYYITNKIGVVREVKKHKFDYDIDIVVDYGNNDICEYEIGADIIRPFLLHYRNDYDYSIIDFNNLPKRQERRYENGYDCE